MAESIKSRYKPSNPKKYNGNPNNIICRSSWERKFCQWCDRNKSVVSWASEEISIPYVSPKDNRIHRYYPDFLIKVKEYNNKIQTYVVEVKPKKQTLPPKKKKKITKSYIYECTTYAVNPVSYTHLTLPTKA